MLGVCQPGTFAPPSTPLQPVASLTTGACGNQILAGLKNPRRSASTPGLGSKPPTRSLVVLASTAEHDLSLAPPRSPPLRRLAATPTLPPRRTVSPRAKSPRSGGGMALPQEDFSLDSRRLMPKRADFIIPLIPPALRPIPQEPLPLANDELYAPGHVQYPKKPRLPPPRVGSRTPSHAQRMATPGRAPAAARVDVPLASSASMPSFAPSNGQWPPRPPTVSVDGDHVATTAQLDPAQAELLTAAAAKSRAELNAMLDAMPSSNEMSTTTMLNIRAKQEEAFELVTTAVAAEAAAAARQAAIAESAAQIESLQLVIKRLQSMVPGWQEL